MMKKRGCGLFLFLLAVSFKGFASDLEQERVKLGIAIKNHPDTVKLTPLLDKLITINSYVEVSSGMITTQLKKFNLNNTEEWKKIKTDKKDIYLGKDFNFEEFLENYKKEKPLINTDSPIDDIIFQYSEYKIFNQTFEYLEKAETFKIDEEEIAYLSKSSQNNSNLKESCSPFAQLNINLEKESEGIKTQLTEEKLQIADILNKIQQERKSIEIYIDYFSNVYKLALNTFYIYKLHELIGDKNLRLPEKLPSE